MTVAVHEGPSPIAVAVRRGLTSRPKRLPAWLFYDEIGAQLFERITRLPEYYVTRTERGIFERDGDAIIAAAVPRSGGTVVELGAGSAEKTQILLARLAARHGRACYTPLDVCAPALHAAKARLARVLPQVDVRPRVVANEDAPRVLASLDGPKTVLFIGSSIGNYDLTEARALLRSVRRGLARGDTFVLGADLLKDRETLVRAYDDAQGVTAAFNKNVLARIDRELCADFDLSRFAHVALFNEAESRIEMHLESTAEQDVSVLALDLRARFARGERVHTESSLKLEPSALAALLASARLRVEATFTDDRRWFGVFVARAV